MNDGKIIVEKTHFLYEDGRIYYFDVKSRNSNDFHNLFVYTKEVENILPGFFGRLFNFDLKSQTIFKCINENNPELINVELDLKHVKGKIKTVLKANVKIQEIEGWDGIVGDMTVAMKRELQLNNLLDDE